MKLKDLEDSNSSAPWTSENTEKAMKNLKEGDYFSEMCHFWLRILKINEDGGIITAETEKRQWVAKAYRNAQELRDRFAYGSIDGYWVSYHGNSLDKGECTREQIKEFRESLGAPTFPIASQEQKIKSQISEAETEAIKLSREIKDLSAKKRELEEKRDKLLSTRLTLKSLIED